MSFNDIIILHNLLYLETEPNSEFKVKVLFEYNEVKNRLRDKIQ